MSNHASKIVVGANGTVYVAPVGTAAPTDATTALNVGFLALGYVSENGVTITPSQTVTPIMAWQSVYAVRKIITARGLEFDYVLREFNAETLPLAFGGGVISTIAGKTTYTPPSPQTVDVRAMVVDWQDGTRNYRVYVPNGQVTDIGAFTVSRTAPAELSVKFELNDDGTGQPWRLFSDDPGLGS
jgi:hypothetical protein